MSNLMFVILIGLSAGLLLLFLYAAVLNARRSRLSQIELVDLVPKFLPVDLQILNELVDPVEQRHLQETYGHQALVRISRERVRITMECLQRMSHNAALLQQLGYQQLNSGNQLLAELGQEMIDAGVHVRLYSLMALVVLQMRHALRWLPLASAARCIDVNALVSANLLPAYEMLKDKTGNLTCLKFSGFHEALSQSL